MQLTNIILKSRQYSGKLHYLVIGMVLLAISLINWLGIILLIIYWYILWHYRLIGLKGITLLLILYFYFILWFYLYPSSKQEINGLAYVSDVKKNYFTFYYLGRKYLSYTPITVKPGDIIFVKGSLETYLEPSYVGDFSTKYFLRGQSLSAIYQIETYEIKLSIFSFNRLRKLILSYYEEKINERYFPLFSCLVLGENILEDTTTYAKLNMLHILALSGFHLLLIYKVVFFLIFQLCKKYVASENLTLIILFFYTLLCGASLSILRAYLYLLGKTIRERLKLGFTDLDLYSLTFLILLLKPLSIFNLGFVFSQLASFIMLYKRDFISKGNAWQRQVKEGLLFLAISFPFITQVNNTLSIWSLGSFLFVDVVSTIIIPINFIFLIFPVLSDYLIFIITGFDKILLLFSNSLTINFPYMNNYFKIIYYLLLILLLVQISRKKPKLFVVSIILTLLAIYYLEPKLIKEEVVFLDVGQGDACYIKANNKSYLIDCYNAYDYLKKRGISHLDSIFISHSDSDHLGDLAEILANIEVENVYFSLYDEITPTYQTTSTSFIPLTFGQMLRIGTSTIRVISGFKEYTSVNDNSLLLEVNIMSKTFLFTGDISQMVEHDILNYINKVYLLKVAHHGSDTSSSIDFLEKARPEIAIISVGYENKYGFPNPIVVERLENICSIYLTYRGGNITILPNKIKTYHKNMV